MVTSVSSSTTSTATTTSSTTSSTSKTATGNASAKAAAQSLITSLGSGSGVDINSLANNLANAEVSPQKAAIQGKIDKSNSAISGYSAIKFVLGNLQTAFADLKDQSDFSSITPSNSQPSAFNVTAGPKADTGSHSVVVNSIAKAQRSVSPGFATIDTKLNSGNAFKLNVSVHGGADQTINLPQGYTAPQDIVIAINASSTGLKAQLVNTGDANTPYKVMVTGATGAANDFTITTDDGNGQPVSGLDFNTKVQTATSASLVVDGITITSNNNQIKDAIAGVTLDLFGTTTGTEGALLNLNRDTSGVKTKIQALVTSYNDALSMLGVVSDPKSTVETYGATLVGNNIVGTVRSQIREMVVSNSTSPSGSMTALRDLGVSIDKSGQLQIDSSKLDNALQSNFDGVVKMLSNNQENQGKFSTAASGIAGEAYKKLTSLLEPTGTLTVQSTNQTNKIADYQKKLDALQTRMETLLKRYTDQFSAMDSLVGQIKSTQTGLKSSFEGMMAAYTNK